MRRYSEEERAKILRAHARFEGSQASFCREHEVSVGTLQNWLRAMRAGQQARPGFVEVHSRGVVDGGAITLRAGGVEVSFSSRPEPEYLAKVLRAMA